MNRLVLIDGNAVLHRAYHAIPPLTAPDGSVVNAVYGFGTMLVRLIHDLKPTHVAVAFDRPVPTFRKKMFEGYQAKRPKMDDELSDQIPKVHKLIEAFGIPIFEKDGFEADDVIGTLARRELRTQNPMTNIDQVVIVTGDRDILQLVVDEKILVYMPTKGLSEAKLYGEKEVIERMGIPPNKIADYKSLAGDQSDNYPGVEGVGPKTAVTLIEKFGSVEELYTHVDKKDAQTKDMSAGLIAKLEAGKESAILGKDLATIRIDVPLEGDITPLESLNRPEVVTALTHFGFRNLLTRIQGREPVSAKGGSASGRKKENLPPKKESAGEQQQLL